jgi:hypothetical protein
VAVANQDYADYSTNFLVPSYSLMIQTGLWISLVAIAGFVVGLGLSSVIGQRTVPVIILIVWELVLTPALSVHLISHLLNVQRGILGLALGHLEPGGLPLPFGPQGGGGAGPGNHGTLLLPESTLVAALVIVGWLVFWTVLGAWRMATRDA